MRARSEFRVRCDCHSPRRTSMVGHSSSPVSFEISCLAQDKEATKRTMQRKCEVAGEGLKPTHQQQKSFRLGGTVVGGLENESTVDHPGTCKKRDRRARRGTGQLRESERIREWN
jgi:hypothetical protein